MAQTLCSYPNVCRMLLSGFVQISSLALRIGCDDWNWGPGRGGAYKQLNLSWAWRQLTVGGTAPSHTHLVVGYSVFISILPMHSWRSCGADLVLQQCSLSITAITIQPGINSSNNQWIGNGASVWQMPEKCANIEYKSHHLQIFRASTLQWDSLLMLSQGDIIQRCSETFGAL